MGGRGLFLLFFFLFWTQGLAAQGLIAVGTRPLPGGLRLGELYFSFDPRAAGEAEILEEDRKVRLGSASLADLLAGQENLITLRVPGAWRYSRGEGVLVAIIDTGVDVEHPDLKPNLWRNRGEDWLGPETPGHNGLDDDGNGVVDDYYGYNALYDTGQVADDHGHGTAVAGLVAAVADGRGITGVAPRARLLPIKALDENGEGFLSGIIKGIYYALEVRRHTGWPLVFNLSWTSSFYSRALRLAIIEAAREAQAIFVTAAGNEARNLDLYPTYPASYGLTNVFTVAALDPYGYLAWFSNYGQRVDWVAPGEDLLTDAPGGGVRSVSGTSFATAEVAGLVALVWSVRPRLSALEVRLVLARTAFLGEGWAGLSPEAGLPAAYPALYELLFHRPPALSPEEALKALGRGVIGPLTERKQALLREIGLKEAEEGLQ